MRGGNDFNFENVVLLQYSLYKIKLKRGGSLIDSPEWIRNKLATTNPKNYDGNNCFQYAITVALNHQNIENHPGRISNIEPFIDKYYWDRKNFSLHQKGHKDCKKSEKNMAIDQEKFEQNNKTFALNISFAPHNKETIILACKSKYNRKRKNQVVLLMITDGKKLHYLALKSVRTTNGYNRPVIS